MGNFSDNIRGTLAFAPVASGSTGKKGGDWIDTLGCEGVCFVANVGTCGSTDLMTLQAYHATSTTGTGAAINGASVSSVAGADDKFLMLDIYKPLKRYVQPYISTRGANVELGGIMAYQYGNRKSPVTQSTTTRAAAPDLVVSGT